MDGAISLRRRTSTTAFLWMILGLVQTCVPESIAFAQESPSALEQSNQPVAGADSPPIPSPAAEAGGWTLSVLEALAFSENPSIARAQALVRAARGNWEQVGLPPNPVVGYSGQQIGSRGLAEQDGVIINQDIVRGGKLRLNRQIAAQEVQRARTDLAAQQERVRTDVRIAFYQTLIAQRQIDTTAHLLGLNQQAEQAAESLFKAKETGRIDLLQSRLEVNNARMLLRTAENRHTADWQRLAAVVGRPELAVQPLVGEVEAEPAEYEWRSSLERLQNCSPETAGAIADVERARWAYQRALAEPKPNISVQGLVNARDNGIGGSSDGAVQISLPLPVWNRNQGGTARALNEVAAAERALEQLQLSLQNRLSPVFERYVTARNQVTTYREEILPDAQETLELMRRSYQAGEVGFINLLTVQRTFSQTSLSYLDSLRELRTAEAEIEGLLLSGSLQQK